MGVVLAVEVSAGGERRVAALRRAVLTAGVSALALDLLSEIALAGAAARSVVPATMALAATSRAAEVIRRRRAGEVWRWMVTRVGRGHR